ncbi:ATP-dependent dethiobiotin synthetase BioD 1 [bacterium BMS3Bbin14]|nr:ATP-dependent dethiobiotin synthetase BioD 1 [bacterium BMS3Abin13]GBE53748.1 ATP-dependent dethiobiotin synthetase BioD 1 [bacterium BMS3Bbin14]
MPTLCLCGIDTGTGKSIATGLLARYLLQQGKTVQTQKLVQTGCTDRPGDILTHRRLMKKGWADEDEKGLTCPFCFPFPASPHLAAALAGRRIDAAVFRRTTIELEHHYEWLLIEGTGGLMVPLTEDLLFIDYLAERGYPLILVTTPRLGSINHTLLSLEAIRSRNLRLLGLVYNQFESGPAEIIRDSCRVFSRALKEYGFADRIVILPAETDHQEVDWHPFLAPLS